MVGRVDDHDVAVLFLDEFPVVAVGAGLLLRYLPLADEVGRLGQHLLVHVAQRDDFDRGDLDEPEEVEFAVPSAADHADPEGLSLCFGGTDE